MDNPSVSQMEEREIQLLLDWAAAEGWNPGLEDARAFFVSDPDGFHMLHADKKPVAGISVVRQNDAHAFLGLYICHPDYRGKGLGLELWKQAIETAQDRTVALDGVVEQQHNYRKSGFEFAWRNIRYSGPAPVQNNEQGSAQVIRPVNEGDIEELIKLDASVGGIQRKNFLSHWLENTPTRTSMLVDAGSAASAFATIRQCQEHFKIGPVIAASAVEAESLIIALAKQAVAEQIIIDVPEPNETACALALKLGLSPVFETARMYRGEPPECDLQRLFGVATLELG